MLWRPWLREYETLLQDLGTDPWQNDYGNWFETCDRRLHDQGRALQFVSYPADLRLTAIEYERRIIEDGQITSRHDLHDAINALVWLRFPDAKRTVSQLHLSQTRSSKAQGTRGKRRDAATLFDEQGLVCLTRDPDLISGLQRHQWQKYLFEDAARLEENACLVVFGHALLARLATPHKSLIAHVMPVIWQQSDWPAKDQWDALIAAHIGALTEPKDLFALPVMGLPGWSEHQDKTFYEDLEVFRPLRAEQ